MCCLAFDEMVVNNTADAAIMARLFTALIRDEGVTVVTTSNRPPHDLYKDGLAALFLPFVDLVEAMDVLPLNGPTDYRLDRLGDIATCTPIGRQGTAQVREAFFRLTDYAPEDAEHVPSAELELGGGRTIHVPKSLKGVGVFSFKRLCGENRGAADYLAIAHAYHTVIVVGVPAMSPDNRNEAIRTKLIDASTRTASSCSSPRRPNRKTSTPPATARSSSSAPSAGSRRCRARTTWRGVTAPDSWAARQLHRCFLTAFGPLPHHTHTGVNTPPM